jgi:D-alanyl-D-alanine dipeptidase
MKFVDVKKYKFIAEPRYYFYGWSNQPKILGRESAVKALVEAKNFLPKDYNFKIWDCQRSRKVNVMMVESFKKRLKAMYLKLSYKERMKLLIKFCGSVPPPIRVTQLGTHRNGGSFDLTIIDERDNELSMGTDFDDLTERAATDFFEKKKQLNLLEREAKKNRRTLKTAMAKAGFKNYAPEWWHWSFYK